MNIVINNKTKVIADNLTLSQALQVLQISSLNGIAIAVNNVIINKKDWEDHQLQPNDTLVLIRASQGG
jgi:sulfur carrier protein